MNRATASSAERNYVRIFMSRAEELRLDGQGRLSVPSELRRYAQAVAPTDGAVLGIFRRIEIWPLANWKAYLAASEAEFAQLDELF